MEGDDGRQAELDTISVHLVTLITEFRPFRISIKDRVPFVSLTGIHNQWLTETSFQLFKSPRLRTSTIFGPQRLAAATPLDAGSGVREYSKGLQRPER